MRNLFTLIGVCVAAFQLGAMNYSGVFNGVTTTINANNSVGNGIRSIEFWFKPAVTMDPSTGATGWSFIIRDDATQNSEYGFYIRGTDWSSVGGEGYLHFFVRYSNVLHEIRSDQDTWNTGTWYHAAGVIDPSAGMKMYINGVQQAQTDPSATQAVSSASENTYIGSWGGALNRMFHGQMEEMRLWTRAITQNEIQTKMCQVLVPANETGLEAYYKFDEGTGGQLIDATANAHTGAATALTWSTDVACPTVTDAFVMDFDGASDFVNLSNYPGNAGVRSIEFWFKPEIAMSPSTTETGWSLVIRDDATQAYEYGVYIRGTDWSSVGGEGYLHFFVRYNTVLHEIRSDQSSWAADTWYHFAGVIDQSTGMKMYINGVQQTQADPSATQPVQSANEITCLGSWGQTPQREFNGSMEELRFWNRTITQNEIQAKMCNELVPASETGLVGYWQFNEGSGFFVADSSASGFNGIVNQATWVLDQPCVTGIDVPQVSPVRVNVYPNPSQGIFFVAADVQQAKAEVFDMSGRLVRIQMLTTSPTMIRLDDEPEGLYFLRITDVNGQLLHQQKIVNRK